MFACDWRYAEMPCLITFDYHIWYRCLHTSDQRPAVENGERASSSLSFTIIFSFPHTTSNGPIWSPPKWLTSFDVTGRREVDMYADHHNHVSCSLKRRLLTWNEHVLLFLVQWESLRCFLQCQIPEQQQWISNLRICNNITNEKYFKRA